MVVFAASDAYIGRLVEKPAREFRPRLRDIQEALSATCRKTPKSLDDIPRRLEDEGAIDTLTQQLQVVREFALGAPPR